MPSLDPGTTKFIIFSAFSMLCLAAGNFSRRNRWVHEEVSKPIHFHTVLWLWSANGIISIWGLRLSFDLIWLILVVGLSMLICTYAMVWICKAVRFSQNHTGVLAVGACISNTGMTLGSYLCYKLLKPETEALAYANAMCYLMLLFAVPIVYPIARACGHTEGPVPSRFRLLLDSMIDIRSVGLFASVIGLALAVCHVPYPNDLMHNWHIIDLLAYMTAGFGYFGIGLRLRMGDSLAFIPQHAVLNFVKFILSPLVMYGLLYAINHSVGHTPPLMNHMLFIQASVSAGVSIVIVSNMFHLDARMASVLWVWDTLLFLTIPVPIIIWQFGS
jgi:hypothetical protein